MKESDILIIGSFNGFITSVIAEMNYPCRTFVYDLDENNINQTINGMMKDEWLQYLYKNKYIIFTKTLPKDDTFEYCVVQMFCEKLFILNDMIGILRSNSSTISPYFNKSTQKYETIQQFSIDIWNNFKNSMDYLTFWN